MDARQIAAEVAALDAERKLLNRAIAVVKSRDSLLDFMRLTMPDPEDVDDAERSLFCITPLAKLLCELLEKVERGELLRVCVSVGPQFGKSQIISRGFPAWAAGRKPSRNFMLGTYNQDFAEEFGGEVRGISTTSSFRQVFPKFAFKPGSAAKDFMVTMAGGKMSFVGRGGSGTGKPADIWVVDDALKDDKEAQSVAVRKELRNWLTKVVFTRCHSKSAVVILNTRWHDDDPIGWLCDPSHPDHDPLIAKNWTYINLPAVVSSPELAAALGLKLEVPTDPEVISQFGDKPMAALWDERKPLTFLAEQRRLDPKGFEALYMGNPTPDDGDFFKSDWLVGYKPEELPRNLMKYSASDHAISVGEGRDSSCFGTVGVDSEGIIWVLPDLYWEKEDDTNVIVDEMLRIMRDQKPLIWWAERGHISKAILPFLRTRMIEENVMQTLVDDSMIPSVDKKTRARSIQGMMSLKRVRFPTFAPWWQAAKNEMLKFPNATHDDFVDFLSWAGIGLMREVPASSPRPADDKIIKVGSIQWVKGRSRYEERELKRQKALRGM